MTSRRQFLAAAAAGLGVSGFNPQAAGQRREPSRTDSGNLFAMDQEAWRSVRLAPKPGAKPSMTPDERDALEHRIRCQCGCTLDVFTCRTTDFSCQVSPAMHRDVMAMVDGGYSAEEILNTFIGAYGDRVLMAPPKVGFNIVGYVLPGIGIAVGALALLFVIRGLRPAAVAPTSGVAGIDATPEELARLDAALKDDA